MPQGGPHDAEGDDPWPFAADVGAGATQFRDGQWEAIDLVANQRQRLLVVQRTGWGKSVIYFLAARVLRDAGAGLALLISPLLALMRNQILAAGKLGIRAKTIHSQNLEDWPQVEAALRDNQVGALMVSPERLGQRGLSEEAAAAHAGEHRHVRGG